jgi:hypothetical protein
MSLNVCDLATLGDNRPNMIISICGTAFKVAKASRQLFSPGNTKEGSIIVLLASCLTGLQSAV